MANISLLKTFLTLLALGSEFPQSCYGLDLKTFGFNGNLSKSYRLWITEQTLLLKVDLSQKVQDSFFIANFATINVFRFTVLNYYIHYIALTKCQFSKHLLLHVQSIYRFKK